MSEGTSIQATAMQKASRTKKSARVSDHRPIINLKESWNRMGRSDRSRTNQDQPKRAKNLAQDEGSLRGRPLRSQVQTSCRQAKA